MNESTIDKQEISKFEQHASMWWDNEGPLKTLHDINPVRLEYMRSMVDFSGKTVLDVGCGGGLLTEVMAKEGASCLGIDAEAQAIETAQAHAKKSGLDIRYIATPIEDFDAPGFDVITCMEMLEHVQEPELVLKHCARLLKPGGLLFLSTINRTAKAYATAIIGAEYLLHLLPKQTHDFDKFITPSELMKRLRPLGFELLDLQGMGYNPLLRRAKLSDDLCVNYLCTCQLAP